MFLLNLLAFTQNFADLQICSVPVGGLGRPPGDLRQTTSAQRGRAAFPQIYLDETSSSAAPTAGADPGRRHRSAERGREGKGWKAGANARQNEESWQVELLACVFLSAK